AAPFNDSNNPNSSTRAASPRPAGGPDANTSTQARTAATDRAWPEPCSVTVAVLTLTPCPCRCCVSTLSSPRTGVRNKPGNVDNHANPSPVWTAQGPVGSGGTGDQPRPGWTAAGPEPGQALGSPRRRVRAEVTAARHTIGTSCPPPPGETHRMARRSRPQTEELLAVGEKII